MTTVESAVLIDLLLSIGIVWKVAMIAVGRFELPIVGYISTAGIACTVAVDVVKLCRCLRSICGQKRPSRGLVLGSLGSRQARSATALKRHYDSVCFASDITDAVLNNFFCISERYSSFFKRFFKCE